jgi:hypothetical protein
VPSYTSVHIFAFGVSYHSWEDKSQSLHELNLYFTSVRSLVKREGLMPIQMKVFVITFIVHYMQSF